MRVFFILLILILSLQSGTRADDINDFEIEGISVGESMLKYLSKSEVIKKINHKTSYKYPKNQFVSINYKRNNLDIFDALGVVIKKNDPKFIIYSVEATIYFWENNIDECYKKQKQIRKDLELFFGNETKIETYDTINKQHNSRATKSIDKSYLLHPACEHSKHHPLCTRNRGDKHHF